MRWVFIDLASAFSAQKVNSTMDVTGQRGQSQAVPHFLRLPPEVIAESVFPCLGIRDLEAFNAVFSDKNLGVDMSKFFQCYHYASMEEISMEHIEWLQNTGVTIITWALRLDQVEHLYTLKAREFTTFEEYISQYMIPQEKVYRLIPRSSLKAIRLLSYSHDTDEELNNLLQDCPQLEALHLLRHSYSQQFIVNFVRNCGQLRAISLDSYDLRNSAIEAICEHCPLLESITLNECYALTDASLIVIASTYPHLQSISMKGCQCADDGLLALANNCHELRSVAFRGNNIAQSGLCTLWTNNTNLVSVDISENKFISDYCIILLAQCCPNLTNLCLYRCPHFSDASIIAVAEHCPHLTSLDVRYSRNISDAALIALGQHCHELKSIDISWCAEFSCTGIAEFAAGCTLLQEFSANMTCANNAIINSLVRSCHNLRKINVSYCKSIGIDALSAIAENCPLISELDLCRCNVDDACLYVIAQHCRQLATLNISVNQQKLSCDAVASIIRSCPHLAKLTVYVARSSGMPEEEYQKLQKFLHSSRRYQNIALVKKTV